MAQSQVVGDQLEPKAEESVATADDIATWDAEAEAFDGAADHGLRDLAVRQAWRELLLGRLPEPPARIADLGCGTGALSVVLGGPARRLTALTSRRGWWNSRLKADGLTGLRFLRADALDPPLPEASYDVVLVVTCCGRCLIRRWPSSGGCGC